MEHGTIPRVSAALKSAANVMMRATAETGHPPLPYFCECHDVDCLRAIWLSPEEYDRRARLRVPLLCVEHTRPLVRAS